MELNDKIEAALKFSGDRDGIPQQDHTQQVRTAMEWAQRHESVTEEEPIKRMPPIIPLAN